MRVGIFSDSHDRLDKIKHAMQYFAAADISKLVCAGDIVAPFAARLFLSDRWQIHCVYGNNDGERKGLKNVLVEICDPPLVVQADEKRLLVVHSEDQLPSSIQSFSLVVFGHSHQTSLQREGEVQLLNPGELCGYLTGKSSIALWDTSTNKIDIIWI